jgi:uncharacterized membrane protein
MRKSGQKILRLVQLAMLAALIVVLQSVGGSIPLGMIPLTFALVPIVVGAILLGPLGGAILGFVFGLVTVIMTPGNTILMTLFQANPVCYIILALAKATLAGWGCGLIYKALDKCFRGRFVYLATVIASVAVPMINTGIFILGMFVFFSGTAAGLPQAFPDFFGSYNGSFQVIVIGLVGFNFLGEFLVNLVLSPAISRIIQIAGKKFIKG